MNPAPDDDDDLRRAFAAGAEWAPAAGAEACPPAERLWSAAAGELPPEERRAVIDHSSRCAACAEDFRVAAGMVRAAGAAPASTQPAASAGGGVVVAGPWLARPQSRWLLSSVAATFFLAAIFAGLFGRFGGEVAPPVYRGGENDIVSLLGPAAWLPREAATLRWQGPAGARYEITVTTADLEPVAAAGDLVAGSYTLPPAQLAALPAETLLLWRVEAVLPDGRRLASPTFEARLAGELPPPGEVSR